MSRENEPLIVIVSAPSGSGKTTIINRVIKEVPGIRRTVSYTTRAPREGEKDREDYVFVTEEEFDAKRDAGEMLEWETNFGYYYGTSKRQLEEILGEGDDVILSIDVKGARKVKEEYPGAVSVFIMPPSKEELAERLKRRNTDKEDEVSLRLKESRREMASSDEYDYMIVNSDLEEAVKELRTIIEGEKSNRKGKGGK